MPVLIYRQKPVEVEAIQFTDYISMRDMRAWVGDCLLVYYRSGERPLIELDTKEGHIPINLGDWLVKDADGDIFKVPPETFALLYESTGSQKLPIQN